MIETLRYLYNNYFPQFIKNKITLCRWAERGNRIRQNKQIRILKKNKQPVKVLFIVSSLPMWRGQGLYDLLKKDTRFDPHIIIVPFKRNNREEAIKYTTEINAYFLTRGITPVKAIDKDFDIEVFFNDLKPDIIFPCQPYNGILGNKLDIEWNLHKTIYCYIPYYLPITKYPFLYNLEFHNLCWKYYLPTELHYKTAKYVMANGAKNVVVVGDSDYDKFIKSSCDPWKKIEDGKERKRIIWAPHFSLVDNELLNRTGFLWLSNEMVKFADKYKDVIQIAFKPHPHLHSVLCNMKDWGKDKTQGYYELWASMPNTQLEEGEFIDLFYHSDAMIHDSGSFTAEYLYVNRPVMFTTKNIDFHRNEVDEFGLKCLDLHYVGKSPDDIRSFIENVVVNGNDKLKEERSNFYNDYLIPPNGRTVAENIYEDLLESFGFSKP